MARLVMLAVALASLLLAGGCHTVVNGTTQPIVVNSDPPGALVQVEGMPIQTTPAVLRLPRGFDSYVSITKVGFEPAKVFVTSTLASGSIGQTLASGAIVGAAIDIASGAAYKLSPDKIDVVLKPVASANAAAPDAPAVTAPASPSAKVSSRPHVASLAPANRPLPPAPATVEPADDDAAQATAAESRLRHIRRMLAEGLITDDEYTMLRARILKELAQVDAAGR